jgi:DNA-directed RNA polymerase specialized sigma24 family protein
METRPHRPSIPESVRGLLHAIRLHDQGDSDPLDRWIASERPVMIGVLRRLRIQESDAEDIIQQLLLVAVTQTRERRAITRELGYLSGILRNLVAEYRRRRREMSLGDRDPVSTADPTTVVADLDERSVAHVRRQAAARRLPPPYAQICMMELQEGVARCELVAWLRKWARSAGRGLTEASAQKAVQRAHHMLESCLTGQDLVRARPGSFNPRKNPWILSPPPPPHSQ